MKQFVVFEMNSAVKKMDYSDIIRGLCTTMINNNKNVLRKIVKNKQMTPLSYVSSKEIYLPFRELRRGRYRSKHKDYYINGYGFFEYDPNLDFLALEKADFIDVVLKDEISGRIDLLDESVIREEQSKMLDYFSGTFKEGQLVLIVDGNYSNMPARIVGHNKEDDIYDVVVITRSTVWELSLHSMELSIRDEDILVLDDYLDEEE